VAGSALAAVTLPSLTASPDTVGVGCEAIDGQVIAQRQAKDPVATAAGLRRDILGV